MSYKCLSIIAAAILLAAQANAADPAEISRFFDRLYRASYSESTALMTVTTPNYERSVKMKMWSKGLDFTLIRILHPPKERGIATLKRGGEMWNFLPKINKTMRVPPSMMSSSWMGSDLTNDDLVRHTSWEKDYEIEAIDGAKPGLAGLRYTPKPEAAVAWSRIEAHFEKETLLPVVLDFYDEKGRKARVMEFSDTGKLGGRLLPRKITVIPLDEEKKGNRTSIQYEEAKFDAVIPDEFFSQTNLREGGVK